MSTLFHLRLTYGFRFDGFKLPSSKVVFSSTDCHVPQADGSLTPVGIRQISGVYKVTSKPTLGFVIVSPAL